MSRREAIQDGIRIGIDSAGYPSYYPSCRICGTPIYTWSYQSGTQYACPSCRKEAVAQESEKKTQGTVDKKERKLETAVKRISKVTDIKPYDRAIQLVKNRLNKSGWFQSTEEIMVALELIRQGVKTHHQVKVYEYSVDFILTELKVALEIDGPIYHGKDKRGYQEIRDDAITRKLGEGWQVIRIPTVNINENITRLMPGIHAVLTRRKMRRSSL